MLYGRKIKPLPQKKVLSKFEIFKNQLSWKRFYENCCTNSLPGLDSIKQRQLELASLLNKAKIAQNTSAKDSIANLINRHQRYKKEIYPQWELLSDFEFSLQTLQTQLAPNELILKYIMLDNEIAVYTISKKDMKVTTLPWISTCTLTLVWLTFFAMLITRPRRTFYRKLHPILIDVYSSFLWNLGSLRSSFEGFHSTVLLPSLDF